MRTEYIGSGKTKRKENTKKEKKRFWDNGIKVGNWWQHMYTSEGEGEETNTRKLNFSGIKKLLETKYWKNALYPCENWPMKINF